MSSALAIAGERLEGRRVEGKSLPSEDREAVLLWRLRGRIARTHLIQLFTTARLRTTLVVALSMLFWAGLFALFYEGFRFLVHFVGSVGDKYHADTVRFVFHLFFASLNVMLVFSSAIITYGGLFASPETRFLLSLPARAERVVLHKFQESVIFSSWGFFLLASPLAVAYGIVADAGWHYFALTPALIIAFVYIPCAIGAVVCLGVVRAAPGLWRSLVSVAAAAVIVIAVVSIWGSVHSPQAQLFGAEWFEGTLQRFRFTQMEWLPSSWLSYALIEAARPTNDVAGLANPLEVPYMQSCLYLALLISNALMGHMVVIWAAKHWYRDAYTLLECRDRPPRRARMAVVDRVVDTLLRPLPSQVRLLLVKDWRLLRRDPVQWTQFLIFFGLLGLYFLNMDRFSNPGNDVSYVTWVNMVSFLNLAVVGLILSTFTTRFIYPMISLEGRRFWVLGLMPIERRTIVISKFLFAAIGSWAPCSVLVLLSDLMLQVPMLVIVVHQLTTVLLCFGLASMAVGLGATMPDFRESSPSKIAAGFGGTLNLVLSALYIILVVVLTALPCHFYLIADGGPLQTTFLDPQYLRLWLVGGAGLAVLAGVAATVVPLWQGIRSFSALEFQ